MPRGGHNKKSKEQAELSGTARSDRHTTAKSIAPGVPDKPAMMSDEASELWDVYVPMFADAGILEQIDALGLAQLFEAYSLACAARETVGDAVVYEKEDQFGNITLVKHPGVTAWKDAVGVLRGLLADHGMSPLARTRMASIMLSPSETWQEQPVGAPPKWTPKVVAGGKAPRK